MTDSFRLLPSPGQATADAEPAESAPLRDELQARRAVQRERAERARLGEIDQGCPECGPASPVTDLAGEVPGWVAVLVEIPASVYGDPEPYTQVQRRPCFTCNRPRWEAWQTGDLTGTRSRTSDPDQIARRDREQLR
jgi:hypothetical protein